jgi:preprotein translocase subunit SecE
MDKLKALYKDYAEELLYKVQWPSLGDLQSSTITVLIASLIIALIIGFMDFGFKFITDFLYGIF